MSTPKRHLKRAFGEGLRRSTELAALFAVSERAIDVRLAQVGLDEPRPRCSGPAPRAPGRSLYFRLLHPNWARPQGVAA